ncbi:MAG: ATP-binding protein [Anaerolineales bacterium]
MKTNGDFYLGRAFDVEKGERLAEPLLYDPDDLTTHGVVVGMTGSGKTGLCIDLLEEAALQGIPALLVDPKGDLANLLLHFPTLQSTDFEPWIDAEGAKRQGKSVEQAAAEAAEIWRSGLKEWDIEPDRIAAVQQAVDYALYTPGAQAGRPVDILTALSAPTGNWQETPDRFRDKISTTATALLGLVDIESDPVKSREHILLSNLLEQAWEAGRDLDLAELIQQIQNPPMTRLGALEVDQFFPQKDRFELAMTLNSLLASPSFEAWTVGEPLDIDRLLWTVEGKPRQTVFYLAHLPESERMFFVTLLLGALDAWMRGQAGSSGLRALFYMDEVFGYLPPTAVPPSKPTFLRLLKQARAFGLGLLLSTQNPVDLDYKALSNAGTWFIGRLQTEQDKNRLLDGLESASGGKGGFDRKQADGTIARLGKRVFLLHNVHEKAPKVFQTRWAMAYLAGPLTLPQIKKLSQQVGGAPLHKKPVEKTEAVKSDAAFSRSRPAVPSSAAERFLALSQDQAGASLVYQPALFGQAAVRFLDRSESIDEIRSIAVVAAEPDRRGMVRWEEHRVRPIPFEKLSEVPRGQPEYQALESPLNDDSLMNQLQKDFDDYLYRTAELSLMANPELDLVAAPDELEEDFRKRCLEEATERRDEEAQEIKKKYQKKIDSLKNKISREERELAEDMADLSSRRMEEWATHAENLLGFLGGSRSRRRVSSSLSKRRMTTKAKADLDESQEVIAEFQQDLEELELEMGEELDELSEHWVEKAETLKQEVLTPRHKDIHVELFGVLWLPHWRDEAGQLRPAYETELIDSV